MKKRMFAALAAIAVAASPQLVPMASAETRYHLNDAQINADGKLTCAPKWFADHNTAYMPVYYVMQLLKNALDIDSHWDGKRWDMSVPTSLGADVSNVHAGSGSVGIYINGTLVQRVNSIVYQDPASHQQTTYLPVWYVMQVLHRINVHSVWNNGLWSMFTNIPNDELQAYQKAHPGWQIGYAAAFTWHADDKPSLFIENRPAPSPYQPVTLTVVSPTLQVTDIKTEADAPGYLQAVPQSAGNMAAVYGNAGAHNEKAYILTDTDGVPTVLKDFSGDNGVLIWIQDGVPQVLVSNRTYNWDLVGPDGQKDDSADNVVYRYSGGSFTQIVEYKTGVFEYEPQFQTDPAADAAGLVNFMVHNAQSGPSMAGMLRGWKSELYSESFIRDVSNADLSGLRTVSTAQSLVIGTVQKTDSKVVYSVSLGAHTLYLTLQNDKTWSFTDFSVDVNPVPAK